MPALANVGNYYMIVRSQSYGIGIDLALFIAIVHGMLIYKHFS